MSTSDSAARIENAIEWLQHVRSGLSARFALYSLNQSPDT